MFRQRNHLKQHVYQYSSLPRELNPVSYHRLSNIELELISYRDPVQVMELNWGVDMNTGFRAGFALQRYHVRVVLEETTANTMQYTKNLLRAIARGFKYYVHILLSYIQQTLSSLVTGCMNIVMHIFRTIRLFIGTVSSRIKRLNPEPILARFYRLTHKTKLLLQKYKKYLSDNMVTAVLIGFLVVLSSLTFYQTVGYYIAHMLKP